MIVWLVVVCFVLLGCHFYNEIEIFFFETLINHEHLYHNDTYLPVTFLTATCINVYITYLKQNDCSRPALYSLTWISWNAFEVKLRYLHRPEEYKVHRTMQNQGEHSSGKPSFSGLKMLWLFLKMLAKYKPWIKISY